MKPARALALALPFALLALPTPAAATPNVTVYVAVNASITFPYNEPAFVRAPCAVTLPAGSDGGAVLNASVAAGCIANWTALDFGAPLGLFLHGVTQAGKNVSTDGRNEFTATFGCGGTSLLFGSWEFGLHRASLADGIVPTNLETATVNADWGFPGLSAYAAEDGDLLVLHYVVDTCAEANNLAFAAVGIWPVSPVLLQGNAATDPGTT